MSFFTRAAIGIALIAGIVHVFRKDVQKIARVLQKPAENFVREVKKELDAGGAAAGTKAATVASGTAEAAAAVAARAEIGAAAAGDVRAAAAAAAASAAGQAAVQPPRKDELQ